ncbi:MAG TPA: hypothetical protein VFG72_08555 [Marmoricola sp.]|nr:hypothetical protein [Marmoricola sp.]
MLTLFQENSPWLTPLLVAATGVASHLLTARLSVKSDQADKRVEREETYRTDMRNSVHLILGECITITKEARPLVDERMHTMPELGSQFRDARLAFDTAVNKVQPELERLGSFAQEDDVVEVARRLAALVTQIGEATASVAGEFWQERYKRAFRLMPVALELADELDGARRRLSDLARRHYRPAHREPS